MTTKQKGDAYEEQVRTTLLRDRDYPEAYLWKYCPEYVLWLIGVITDWHIHRQNRRRLQLQAAGATIPEGHGHRDEGVDIVACAPDRVWEVIQCKCYGHRSTIRMECLDGFCRLLLAALEKRPDTRGALIYCGRLCRQAAEVLTAPRMDSRVRIECLEFEEELLQAWESMRLTTATPPTSTEPQLPLWPHQEDALNNLCVWWLTGRAAPRGYVDLPCGTGKTVILGHFISGLEDIRGVVFTVPLLEHAHQAWERLRAFVGETWTVLLVDSEGNRNITSLRRTFGRDNSRPVLVVSTFKSADVVRQLPWTGNWLLVIDEFHNLSKADIGIGEPSDMHALMQAAPRILGLSATPRIYELENNDEGHDDRGYMGEVVHTLPWSEAIGTGLICDYRVWIPSITEPKDHLDTQARELSVDEIDRPLHAKTVYLLKGMLQEGARRCIIYMESGPGQNSVVNAAAYRDMLTKEAQWLGVDVWSERILSEDSGAVRKERIRAFETGPVITDDGRPCLRFLLSLRILDECIDIPACDSVFFAGPSTSKIRSVQRAARAMRAAWSGKTAHVFVWCDAHCDEQAALLSALRERDPDFATKVRVMSSDYDGRDRPEVIASHAADTQLVQNYIVGVKGYVTPDERWTEMFGLVQNFVREHGRLPYQREIVTVQGREIRLGYWIQTQRSAIGNGSQTQDRLDRLLTIPQFQEWYATREETKQDRLDWDVWYDLLLDHIRKNGKLPTQRYAVTVNGTPMKLGYWWQDQLRNIDRGKLSADRAQRMLAIPAIQAWRREQEEKKKEPRLVLEWDVWYDIFKDFATRHGRYPQETDNLMHEGKPCKLYMWIHNQKTALKRDTITPYRRTRLLEIPIVRDWYATIQRA